VTTRYTYKMQCPLYRCGKWFEVAEKEFMTGFFGKCPHCNSPIWPYELGFTGSSQLATSRYAAKFRPDGTPIEPIEIKWFPNDES